MDVNHLYADQRYGAHEEPRFSMAQNQNESDPSDEEENEMDLPDEMEYHSNQVTTGSRTGAGASAPVSERQRMVMERQHTSQFGSREVPAYSGQQAQQTLSQRSAASSMKHQLNARPAAYSGRPSMCEKFSVPQLNAGNNAGQEISMESSNEGAEEASKEQDLQGNRSHPTLGNVGSYMNSQAPSNRVNEVPPPLHQIHHQTPPDYQQKQLSTPTHTTQIQRNYAISTPEGKAVVGPQPATYNTTQPSQRQQSNIYGRKGQMQRAEAANYDNNSSSSEAQDGGDRRQDRSYPLTTSKALKTTGQGRLARSQSQADYARSRPRGYRSSSQAKLEHSLNQSGKQHKATNIREIMVFDALPQRDKDLLEKSQKLLGESKLYELERTHLSIGKVGPSASRNLETSAAGGETQQTQQRLIEQQMAEDDVEGERMKAISREVDQLQRLHHSMKQRKMSKSRDVRNQSSQAVLDLIRYKQEEEWRTEQRRFGGFGATNAGPVFSPPRGSTYQLLSTNRSATDIQRAKSARSGVKKVNHLQSQAQAEQEVDHPPVEEFKGYQGAERNVQYEPSALYTDISRDQLAPNRMQGHSSSPGHEMHFGGSREISAIEMHGPDYITNLQFDNKSHEGRIRELMQSTTAQPREKSANYYRTHNGQEDTSLNYSKSIGQAIDAAGAGHDAKTPLRIRQRKEEDDVQYNDNKQQYGTAIDGGSRKYNLSAQYQHVRSSYMNTNGAVQKLRQQAQELREELRVKNANVRERLGGQWGPQLKKKKKKKVKKTNSSAQTQRSLQQQEAADAVLNRLLQDTEIRRQQKEQIEAANPSYHQDFKYETALRDGKLQQESPERKRNHPESNNMSSRGKMSHKTSQSIVGQEQPQKSLTEREIKANLKGHQRQNSNAGKSRSRVSKQATSNCDTDTNQMNQQQQIEALNKQLQFQQHERQSQVQLGYTLPEDNVEPTDIQRVGTMPLADPPANIELTQQQYHYIQKPQELDPTQQPKPKLTTSKQSEANARVLEYLEKSLKAYEPQATHQLISVVDNEHNGQRENINRYRELSVLHQNNHISLGKITEINSFVEDEARAGANGQAAAIKLHQNAVAEQQRQ